MSKKKRKEAHVSGSKSGDFYGTSIRAKTGTMKRSYMNDSVPASAKSMKKPPKTLA